MTRLALAAPLCAVLCIVPALPAAADPPHSEVLTSVGAYGFTSPGQGIGPWTSVDIQFRSWNGPDTIGIEAQNRVDADRSGPSHGTQVVVDDYHDWSGDFYTYAALSAGAAPFPSDSVYLEADVKMLPSRRLVLGLGADETRNADGTSERFLNVGPTYYWSGFDATLRYLPTSGPNGRRSSAILAAATIGSEGRATTTLTLQAGAANPVIGSGTLATLAGERTLALQCDYKRWTSARGGYQAGALIAHLTDSSTGGLIYVQRGFTLGVFTDFGPR